MTLPTQNPAWGFYGTLHTAGMAQQIVDAAWNFASLVIERETGCNEEAVRRFLDSKQGRHFADDVWCAINRADQNTQTAIQSTCDRWMRWSIGYRTSKETGIPAGMRYLTGFVANEEVMMEAEEGDPFGDWHGGNE